MRLYIGVVKPIRTTILGQELAGEVAAVGKDVTRFTVGDAVFGSTGFHFGAYAEFNCLPAETDDGVLAIKPSNMTYDEAAGVPTGGLEALHFLRLAHIQAGQKILINGAGGSIGTAAVQLAKHYGAEVMAVDSGEKLDMLHSIGADHVIDYTTEDFAHRRETYDVIFDVIGKNSFSRSMRVLNERGIYLMANPGLKSILQGRWVSSRTNKKIVSEFAKRQTEDLVHLKELIEAGVLKTIIDRRYPLEQTAEAHRYVETGRKKGNVIITIAD